MATRLRFVLLPFFFIPSIWSQQTPTCLSPASSGGPANKAACCLGTDRQEESVDGVIYEYVCSHYALTTNLHYYEVLNAYECAKKCSEEAGLCHAASWKPKASSQEGGNCFLAMADFVEKHDRSGEWLLLVRTDRTGPAAGEQSTPQPLPDCQDELDEAWVECEIVADEDCEMRTTFMQQQLDAKDADLVNCKYLQSLSLYTVATTYLFFCRWSRGESVNLYKPESQTL